MELSLKSLKYVLSLAETESISKSSGYFYISRTSFSRVISQTEEELGCQLFERTPNRVYLTNQGRMILPYIRRILELADEMMKCVYTDQDKPLNVVTIGINDSIDTNFACIRRIIDRVHKLDPEFRIEIITGSTLQLKELLYEKKADLILVSQFVAEGIRDSVNVTAYEDCLSAFVHCRSSLAEKDRVTIDELSGEKWFFCSPDVDGDIYRYIMNLREDYNISSEVHNCSHGEMLMRVSMGMGYGISPYYNDFDLASMDVVKLPIYLGNSDFDRTLVKNRHNHSPAVDWIMEIAGAVYADSCGRLFNKQKQE